MAKLDMITYTAPNGETKNSSSRVFTHVIASFDPKEPWNVPALRTWHSSYDLAQKAIGRWIKAGHICLIVLVTADGSRNEKAAAQISAMRTQQDIDNIPAMRIARAERHLAAEKRYLEECKTDYRLRNTTKFISEADLLRFIENAQRRVDIAQHQLETARIEYAPKPEPTVEKPAPKDPRRVTQRAFVRELADAILAATVGGMSLTYTPSDYSVTVERTSQTAFKSVKVGVGGGNFIEIHIPFRANMARRVAMNVFDLIEMMNL